MSYLWVMGSYYKMPENATLLIVTNVEFTDDDATYFNVTILNPSNSVSGTNITGIRLSVEGTNQTEEITDIDIYNATEIQPLTFPYTIQKGTEPKLKCKENWSNFVGKNLKIEPIAVNASTKSYSYTTPNVKLKVTPNFNVSESIEYFNVTVENTAEINKTLTVSEVLLSGFAIPTVPALPYNLIQNQTETFRCDWPWEYMKGGNATVTVRTVEGYETTYITDALLGATISVDEITFDYADTSYFNLTVRNSEDSTARASIDKVNLTLANGTTITLNTSPPIILPSGIPISPNETQIVMCFWDWSTTRNETITATVYTKQGFTAASKTVQTPLSIVWNITEAQFDLSDVGHFTLNVANLPCSLQSINVTQIWLNENLTQMTPLFSELSAGEETQFSCTFNWAQFKGQIATITVSTASGLNMSTTMMLPSVELKIFDASFATSPDGKYFNVTISNPSESLLNLTISRIVVNFENITAFQSEGIESPVEIGKNVTLAFSWNWSYFENESVTITVYTIEGFEDSATFTVKE